MHITVASRADHAALQSLLAAQLAEHDLPHTPERLAPAIDGVLADERRGLFLVARLDEHGEQIVGVAYMSFIWSIEHGGQAAWLDELYVLPAHRNGGVGRALVEAVLERAVGHGCVAVDLEVDTSHARAARLYQRLGFSPHQRARWWRSLR